MRTLRSTLVLALVVVGCGSSANKNDGGPTVDAGTGPYLPLQIGNLWTYQITAVDGTISSKVVSVTAEEAVGGTGPNAAMTAFRVVSGNKANDPNGDLSWQGVVDMRVVRLREISIDGQTGNMKNEQSWDPPRLRIDETADHTAASASWREPGYTEFDTNWSTDPDGGTNYIPDGGVTSMADIQDIWTVVSTSQTITVPAGTFNALALRRVGNGGSSIKNYWFSQGVGLVRESEEGKPTTELSSRRILP